MLKNSLLKYIYLNMCILTNFMRSYMYRCTLSFERKNLIFRQSASDMIHDTHKDERVLV